MDKRDEEIKFLKSVCLVLTERNEKLQEELSNAWQLCPKCLGQGIVSKPPYIAGDVNNWSSSSTSFVCDVCNGAKIIK
jgi:hypothetical protein